MKSGVFLLCAILILAGITNAEDLDPPIHGTVSCKYCHKVNNSGSHFTHIYSDTGPEMICTGCHSINPMTSKFRDEKQFSNTTVCDACHSPEGTYDGVNDTVAGAKPNWWGRIYDDSSNRKLKAGKEKWCIGCHDNSPAIVKGEAAINKSGDNSSYGFYISGHGKESNYERMSWQGSQEIGNPGANISCDICHDANSKHINTDNNTSKRLKPGYEINQNNDNCNNCHDELNDKFYTNSSDYEKSVHRNLNCTECHDIHGMNNKGKAMTKEVDNVLCNSCHNNHSGHALNVQFGKNGMNFSLKCISCHNVHVINGMYNTTEFNKSVVTKLSDITKVWGDDPGEKMNSLGGTYRTPSGDTFSGFQLPDYPTFCLDCHGSTEFGVHGGINWGTDNHGLVSANEPNGYNVCPNWFVCGLADGWEGDLCINESICWPPIPKGRGDQLYSRSPYNHEERIAGANFVLSCTDCHITHESGIGAKLRSTVNGGPGSTIWNTMCNDCHYYYSDWHAGMACGSASCHVSDRMTSTGTGTLHGMSHQSGSGNIRTFNRDLVLDMRFENNLKDSGTFQMDSKWYDVPGSFESGKYGNAAVLNGSRSIQVGTENDYWSTDAGYHGTWVYSEMKKNMTLETWVYPTSLQPGGENHIITKHTYPTGGYDLMIKSIDNSLRAVLSANVNGGGNSSDCNGLRGAYSSVSIPLNRWSHIATTFDSNLPDRDMNNLSVGRIRVYVDGEDVTTSYPNSNSCYAQPGNGENVMFPYSDMNFKNESQCYNGQWCASELFFGGLPWSRNGLIGKMDETRMWNIVKQQSYYDQLIPPKIRKAEGAIGQNHIIITFNEGVYTNPNKSGPLQTGDFILTDLDNSRSIVGVTHSPGDKITNITLSSPLDDVNDIDVDAISAKSNSIYDSYNNPADVESVIITGNNTTSPVNSAIFLLNEPSDSINAADESGLLVGNVNSLGETFLGDGFFHGDGVDNFIDFENHDSSLKASVRMMIETRIKPTNLEGTGNYIRRIFSREGSGNYQITVWRNNGAFAPYFNAPGGVASIAFWLRPLDNHGGNSWKPVLTNYTNYPIVSDHWYKIKMIWNSSVTGQIPGSIYVDDQGTNGNDAGESWAGYSDATDYNQSQLPAGSRLYEGDIIYSADGDFAIGANVGNHTNNVFKGLIDYINITTE